MHLATLEKYQGYYEIIKDPRITKNHNLESWAKIVKLLNAQGKASFDELSTAVKGHLHNGEIPDNEYRFIKYCIDSKWLGAV
jgi:hypothetical protein